MIPENKKLLQFKELAANGIKQLKPEISKNNPNAEDNETGKTEIIPTDIKNVMEKVYGNSDKSLQHTDDLKAPAKTDNKARKYDDSAKWDKTTNIKDFIAETLREVGFDVDNNPDIVNQLFLIIIQNILDKKIDIQTNIGSVTELINMNLTTQNSLSTVIMAQELIQVLLTQKNDESSKITNEDVKKLILNELQIIISADNTTVTPGNGTGDTDEIDPNPATNNLTPVEQAMVDLSNAIDNALVNGEMSIKDFLLQFETQAAQYIQLQFGYAQDFSKIIAKFLATAVSDTCGVESGLIKDAELSEIKESFLAFIQDMSFVDTTDGIKCCQEKTKWTRDENNALVEQKIYQEGIIDYIFAWLEPNGYRVDESYAEHRSDKYLAYTNGETPNNGNFLHFLVEYMRNDIYGGTLNSTQMKAVMTAVIKEFAKGNLTSHYGSNVTAVEINTKRNVLDRDGNGSLFNELLNAMLKVAENNIKPLDTNNMSEADTTSFLTQLFGNKTGLTAAQIMSSENSWLLSNDQGVRGIIQALFDTSEQYNIHHTEDYTDFLNLFIRMIYEKCGEEVVKNSSGKPLLTKDILQKYFAQGNTLQDLKDFIQSKELRNKYYMEYVLEDGGINDTIDNFGQGRSGDCWLLSCLAALNVTEAGRKIISNAIIDNGDGTWTVNFHYGWIEKTRWNSKKQEYETYWEEGPVENSFTISIDEVMDRMGTGNYAFGDPTVVLLEIATSKLREKYDEYFGNSGDKWICGGTQQSMLSYLIGDLGKYKEFSANKGFGTYASGVQEIKDWIFARLDDGSVQEGTVGNYMMWMSYKGHAYAVTKVDRDYIYYCDPYHPEIELKISYADLAAGKVKGTDGKTTTVTEISFGYAALPDISEL